MICEFLFELVFEAAFYAACYLLGQAIVSLISWGNMRCDSLLSEVPKKQRRCCGLLGRRKSGWRITAEATATIGAVCLATVFILGVFAVHVRAAERSKKPEVNGNTVIRRQAGPSEIVIRTTDRLAGAIDSLTWNSKEFIDSTDHGRQLQSAASFDCGRSGEFWAECFNPTEAGSRDDGAGKTSTSKLLSMHLEGPRLESTTQMAFWLAPGEKSSGRPALNDARLSRHLVSKRVSIGYQELPQVIEYQVTFTVPEDERHNYAQFEALTGYMPAEFSEFWKYDVTTRKVVRLDDGPGEQASPVIFATANGSHAMGVYSPDQPSPGYEQAGYGRFRFAAEKVVKWNCVFRIRDIHGIKPDDYSYQLFVAVGTLEDVTRCLAALANDTEQCRAAFRYFSVW